jgi:hypothetical protein
MIALETIESQISAPAQSNTNHISGVKRLHGLPNASVIAPTIKGSSPIRSHIDTALNMNRATTFWSKKATTELNKAPIYASITMRHAAMRAPMVETVRESDCDCVKNWQC